MKTKHFAASILCLLLTGGAIADDLLTTVSTDTWAILYGGKAAYLDYHYLTATIFYAKVTLIDLKTKVKTVVVPSGTDIKYPYYIDFGYSKNHLAYVPFDAAGGGSGGTGGGGTGGGGSGPAGSTAYLYYKNLSTGAIKQLIPGTEWKTMVWVGGDIVTWVDYRNYDSATVDSLNSEIYLYNLATSQEKRVTTDHKYQEKPVTDGQRVAWVDYSAGYGKVFVHTISSGSTAEKGAFAAGKNTPRIDGNTLVWEDYRNAVSNKKNIDIYLCNLATDAVKPICVAANFQGRPFVSGDLVVWEDYRNATAADSMNSDIYGYRISSGTEFALVSGAGYQGHPTLRGDTLCWIEYSGTTIKLMTKVIVSTGSRTGHDNPNRSPITISRSADNRLFVAGALPAQKLNVSIMDMSGRCIIRKNLRTSYNGSAEIAGNAGNGIYVVTVRPDNGAAITETHALYR